MLCFIQMNWLNSQTFRGHYCRGWTPNFCCIKFNSPGDPGFAFLFSQVSLQLPHLCLLDSSYGKVSVVPIHTQALSPFCVFEQTTVCPQTPLFPFLHVIAPVMPYESSISTDIPFARWAQVHNSTYNIGQAPRFTKLSLDRYLACAVFSTWYTFPLMVMHLIASYSGPFSDATFNERYFQNGQSKLVSLLILLYSIMRFHCLYSTSFSLFEILCVAVTYCCTADYP